MKLLDWLWPLLFVGYLAAAIRLSHHPEKNRYNEPSIGPYVSQEK